LLCSKNELKLSTKTEVAMIIAIS